ncbi:hypothetical protein [Bacteroides sp.]|uniref:hypothetical protein n=1 Tax=Bacteroides sp. TaxID=29523 RepID=UPI00260AE1CE|nr:hypothetical protein [Bacteroides sp.]MDD3039561.1 hypothetical protein [Bacteroides sp.]
MTNSEVIMGISFSEDMDQFDDAGNLVFSGPALEAGVWTDAHGNTAYYPQEIIKASAPLFVGVDILCEHQGIPIGKILEVEPTDVGFKVTKGIITSKRMAARVLEKKLRGLSIHANVRVDPVRKIVLEIFGAQEISLVKNPACKVCLLDSYKMQDGDETVVETENKAYESYPEPDCEQFKDSPEIYEACKKFAKAVEVFRKAQEEWHGMFTKKEYGDMKESAMSEPEETPIEVEASAEVDTETEVETEPEIETEVEASAEAEVEVETETETEIEASAEPEVDALKELTDKLEAAQIELAGYRAEISVLTSRVNAYATAERQRLEEAVMSADPNADKEFIATLGAAGLEKYLETVTRMSKPTVGASKKSTRKEEATTVSLSAPAKKDGLTKDNFTSADIIKMLKSKQ